MSVTSADPAAAEHGPGPEPGPGSEPGRESEPGPGSDRAALPAGAARSRPAIVGARLLRFLEAVWRPGLLLGVVFAAWWIESENEYVANYLVPTPRQVFEVLTTQWSFLMEQSLVTLYETLIGFVLASVIGLGTAILIVYSSSMDKALYPIVLFAQVIPKIAIAPLLVVWFGFEMTPKVILAVLIAFFPVVISGVAGFRSTDPELLDLSATMGAGPWQTFRKIRFPNALPQIMAGLKVAVTLAVTGAVVGEFVSAGSGLGYVLLIANGNLDAPLLFASLFLMSAIGIALFVIVEAAEALLIPWHASRRSSIPLTTA